MEGNINKTNGQTEGRQNPFNKQDVKRIRNIIAKYKNKTLDATSSVLHRSKSIDDR